MENSRKKEKNKDTPFQGVYFLLLRGISTKRSKASGRNGGWRAAGESLRFLSGCQVCPYTGLIQIKRFGADMSNGFDDVQIT